MPHSPEGHRKAFVGSGSPGSCFIFCNGVSTHCASTVIYCSSLIRIPVAHTSRSGSTDGSVFPPGCLQKAPIFLPPQLLSLVTKSLVLQLEQLDAAFPCPDKFQETDSLQSAWNLRCAPRTALPSQFLYPMICSFRKSLSPSERSGTL